MSGSSMGAKPEGEEATKAPPTFLREFARAQRSIAETEAQMGDQRGKLRRTIAELREALLSSMNPEQPYFNVTPHPTTGDAGESTTVGKPPIYVSYSMYIYIYKIFVCCPPPHLNALTLCTSIR